MFYESRIVDGQLKVRREPNGPWEAVGSETADVANQMADMTAQQRLNILQLFCSSCGCIQPVGMPCQCWNDE